MKNYFILAILSLTACSHAGPFVTKLTVDDTNTIKAETCYAEYNFLLGFIRNSDCNYEIITFTHDKARPLTIE
jgi:hypothetical protein